MQPAISNSISLFISALPNELNEEKWNAAAIGCPLRRLRELANSTKQRWVSEPDINEENLEIH